MGGDQCFYSSSAAAAVAVYRYNVNVILFERSTMYLYGYTPAVVGRWTCVLYTYHLCLLRHCSWCSVL